MIASQATFHKLLIEYEDQSPESMTFEAGQVVALCNRCPGRIDPNEDSAAVIQTESGAIVLVVADGMGGGPAGHKASAIAVESIVHHVSTATTDDLRPAILDGVEAANEAILDLEIGAATTLAIVEINHGRARGYHVGDSQTLIVGGRGAIKWKSTPQSPIGYAVESGLLDEADAMHHEDRHYVSNMVGSRTMHIAIGPSHKLSPRDTVILASDGLFDNVHMEEVIEWGRRGKLIHRTTTLADLAHHRMMSASSGQPGKPDDLSILMFTAGGSANALLTG